MLRCAVRASIRRVIPYRMLLYVVLMSVLLAGVNWRHDGTGVSPWVIAFAVVTLALTGLVNVAKGRGDADRGSRRSQS